jgi:hypothetical protein
MNSALIAIAGNDGAGVAVGEWRESGMAKAA